MRYLLSAALLAACSPAPELDSSFSLAEDGIDLLLVIDNSGSMEGEQAALKSALRGFLDEMEAELGADIPKMNVGVVSTDMGIGQNWGIDACDEDGDAAALEAIAVDPSDPSFDLDRVASELTGMMDLGIGGCGFEQPLEAMRSALSENSDFVRRDAVLAVIFVTDEDDCSSATPELFNPESTEPGPLSSYRCFQQGVVCEQSLDEPGNKTGCRAREDSMYVRGVEEYATFLKSLEAEADGPSRVLVGGIMGNMFRSATVVMDDGELELVPDQCERGELDEERKGQRRPYRLASFMDQFPRRSVVRAPICAGDYRPFFTTLVDLAGDDLIYCAEPGGACNGNEPCWAECPGSTRCDLRFDTFGVCVADF